MESIFHETQEGSLCAQHCLNSLLQGPFFTAVDLANHAEALDEEERQRMAEGDVESEEYKKFLEEPSHNVDDTGFFSVQVLSGALAVWNLRLVSYNSQEGRNARENPLGERAFICNLQEHWLAVRKLGRQWFNLNSMLSGPELLSDTHLSLFLAQLQEEGYTIFVVRGDLPRCEADEILSSTEAVQTNRPHVLSERGRSSEDRSRATSSVDVEEEDEAAELQRAIALSLVAVEGSGECAVAASASAGVAENVETTDLQRAIALSMKAVETDDLDPTLDDVYVIESRSESDNGDDDDAESEEEKSEEAKPGQRLQRHVSEMSEEEMMEMAMKLSQYPPDS